MKRWKAVALIIVGIIVCLVGLLLGTRFLPTMLLTTVKEKSCINSKDHDSYNRWVSFISTFINSQLSKIEVLPSVYFPWFKFA